MHRIFGEIGGEIFDNSVDKFETDVLLSRISLLAGKERTIMVMYYCKESTVRQIAQLTNMSRAAVGRKIKKITALLTEGRYVTCLRHRDMFTHLELLIAGDHFLQDLSIREIARLRNISYHRVRKLLIKIDLTLRKIDRHECPLVQLDSVC